MNDVAVSKSVGCTYMCIVVVVLGVGIAFFQFTTLRIDLAVAIYLPCRAYDFSIVILLIVKRNCSA